MIALLSFVLARSCGEELGVRMSLETVTGKIDGILQVAVLAISGVLWAVAGFPYLTEVVVFGGLIACLCLFIWWLTSRPQKET